MLWVSPMCLKKRFSMWAGSGVCQVAGQIWKNRKTFIIGRFGNILELYAKEERKEVWPLSKYLTVLGNLGLV